MKCISCGEKLSCNELSYDCEKCARTYPINDGISIFADDKGWDFFPEQAYEKLYSLEKNNFWFNARNNVIGKIMRGFLPDKKSRILDVGCGTGFVSSFIQNLGYEVDCADIILKGLKYCKKRCGKGRYFQLNIYNMPFEDDYDCVCMFDVLEHLDDDALALENAYKSLREGGYLFVTVPAIKSLWSGRDEYARHRRRYSYEELKEKIEGGGFKIQRMSYFMFFLLPILWLSRFIPKKGLSEGENAGFNINPRINRVFFHIFNIESHLIKYMNFPIGSSLLCIAQKGGSL